MLEDLIVQGIEIKGVDLYYIPRNILSYNPILDESVLEKYDDAFKIVGWFENGEFDGEGDILSKFGLEIRENTKLTLAKRHWNKIKSENPSSVPDEPNEGDLIYFPDFEAMFEITFNENRKPFFQHNRNYIFDLSLDSFEYNHEEFNTGVEGIDQIEEEYRYAHTFIINPPIIINDDDIITQVTGVDSNGDDITVSARTQNYDYTTGTLEVQFIDDDETFLVGGIITNTDNDETSTLEEYIELATGDGSHRVNIGIEKMAEDVIDYNEDDPINGDIFKINL